jgi:HEAT repeat protein
VTETDLADIEKALTDREVNVRWAAVSALKRVGGEKAIALLEKALADQDHSVHCQAAWALDHMGRSPTRRTHEQRRL